jgi:hypothetical protein
LYIRLTSTPAPTGQQRIDRFLTPIGSDFSQASATLAEARAEPAKWKGRFKGQDKWVRDLEDRKGNLDEKLKWMEEYQQKIGV